MIYKTNIFLLNYYIMNNKINFNNKIIILGIGGIGKCISHYLSNYINYDCSKMHLVDKDIDAFNFPTVKKLIDAGACKTVFNITRFNYIGFFNKTIEEGDIIIDCTVRTPCMKFLKYLKNSNVYYINTSIEQDKCLYNENYDLYKRSIAKQHQEISKITNVKGRFLIEYGMNPGLITSFLYKALKDSNLKNKVNSIKTIHCSEIDTQIAKKKSSHIFYNTWSAIAMIDELNEESEIYLGNINNIDENLVNILNYNLGKKIKHYETGDYVVISSNNAASNKAISVCYTGNISKTTLTTKGAEKINKNFSRISGNIIHHGETHDIGILLKKHSIGVPSIYYVYNINTEAQKCINEHGLDQITKNEDNVCVMNMYNNKLSGTDNIGIYIETFDNYKWWCGTVLDTNYTKNVLNDMYFGPTTIQVMSGVIGGLLWLLNTDKPGFYFGRDVNHKQILKTMENKLNIVSCEI